MSALITDFVAVCHNEPRGDFGLEGYQRGESYRCQHVKDGDGRPPYFTGCRRQSGGMTGCAATAQKSALVRRRQKGKK